jgi:hypothetical protein
MRTGVGSKRAIIAKTPDTEPFRCSNTGLGVHESGQLAP